MDVFLEIIVKTVSTILHWILPDKLANWAEVCLWGLGMILCLVFEAWWLYHALTAATPIPVGQIIVIGGAILAFGGAFAAALFVRHRLLQDN
ncbi:hypothetical protein [Kordiimonas marina]|uniref:hypothetical protein n=1 Tax=Kordiimonas marina TaxID=2872312 RepID=UPI001FF31799|nr:hypothetical protein [Kordiimonas marina]MCJ9430604.1 hypothetical protein [Kordiimonas marina]